MNKINAAFSIGGPKLLGETIEHNTGLELDGYMEIGFGGFAQVVDAVGGVNICVKNDMDDPKAHINLKKGCQDMDGPTALGYVRARYSDPRATSAGPSASGSSSARSWARSRPRATWSSRGGSTRSARRATVR